MSAAQALSSLPALASLLKHLSTAPAQKREDAVRRLVSSTERDGNPRPGDAWRRRPRVRPGCTASAAAEAAAAETPTGLGACRLPASVRPGPGRLMDMYVCRERYADGRVGVRVDGWVDGWMHVCVRGLVCMRTSPPLGAAKAGRRSPVAGRGSLDTASTALEGFDRRHSPRVLAS